MSRLLTLLAVALAAAPAAAQGFTNPPGRAVPTYPGAPAYYPSNNPVAVRPTAVYPARPPVNVAMPGYGGYGYGGGYYGGGTYYYPPVYSYPAYYPGYTGGTVITNLPATVVSPPPLVVTARAVDAPPAAVADAPAELTLDFPAAATVRVNDTTVDGPVRSQTFASPPLKAGKTHTFDVRASWSDGSRKVEWERKITVGAGEKSRLTVAAAAKE